MPGFAVFLNIKALDDEGLHRVADDFAAAGATNFRAMGDRIVNIDLDDESKATELKDKGYTLMSGRLKALVF